MITRECIVTCETGLHARPASELVKLTQGFECSISASNSDGMETDAKSIIGILSLGADKNACVTFTADGADEEEAIEEIVSLLKNISE